MGIMVQIWQMLWEWQTWLLLGVKCKSNKQQKLIVELLHNLLDKRFGRKKESYFILYFREEIDNIKTYKLWLIMLTMGYFEHFLKP